MDSSVHAAFIEWQQAADVAEHKRNCFRDALAYAGYPAIKLQHEDCLAAEAHERACFARLELMPLPC